ncbi:MAG: response regulator [Anaerolineae bacterium]|nr:response regulator [Anaerolineae bacterium]
MQTILVIEDERGILDNVIEILNFEDFNAIPAVDGKMGVELAQQHLPDLILCDLRMPVLDGYGVVRALRSHPDTADLPLIIMTAKAYDVEEAFVKEMNVAYCLKKPFHAVELLEAVEAHIRKP